MLGHPVVGFLSKVALVGAAFEGTKILYRGLTHVTSGTRAEPIIAGIGDTVANVLDPFHIFTPDPAEQRDKARADAMKAKAKKKAADIRRKAAEKKAKQAEAKARQAESKAAALERQAAEAAARHNQELAEAKKAKAVKHRRFATLATRTAAAARANQSSDQALALAQQALALASAANKPPADAKSVLSSDMPVDMKSLITDIIDSVNRREEPNYDDLVKRIEAGDEAAYGDLVDMADDYDTMGPDESVMSGGECCKACASGKKAACGCAGVQPKSTADIPTHMLFGPDGDDEIIAGSGLDDDNAPELFDEDEDNDNVARLLKDCPTGQCWAK